MEFNSPGSKFTEPKEIVASNLEEYLRQIEAAKKQNVDILVFPEASLNYNGRLVDQLRKDIFHNFLFPFFDSIFKTFQPEAV